MVVTKFVHSCLLVEKDGKKALVDPGNYSWNSGAVGQDMLRDIDYVLVTHAHADHLDETFASVVNELSPNAIWYITPSSRTILQHLPGVQLEEESTLSDVVFIDSEHADLKHWGSCDDHTSFLLFGELFISGDCQSHTDLNGAKYIAGPINGGPWGAIKGELDMLANLKDRPEKFIPLHDWHWHDLARKNFYNELTNAMDELGIEFVAVENGVPVELS